MKRTTLYLTRHGQTVWNVEGKLQGHQDSPLTELGRLQARWLADAMADTPLDAIYSSPSGRAMSTAEIVRGARDLPVVPVEALREINLGPWEGLAGEAIAARHPEAYDAFWKTPHLYRAEHGGESYFDLRNRVVPALGRLLADHAGGAILLVTHAATLKTIMAHFGGLPLSELWQPPFVHSTSLCRVAVEDGVPRIELYGDTSHYREEDG
ncbi:histidine phosphatase family protein [Cohnella sp. REN36]|uniref:histidine phosphatase family protein n=1 Tax=Cohnella sp. REN36 TaxID=2887347 RepID=UPI001D13ED32|nr:histidine phosphatase family protein [Cohnella sp. REN36]MCC3372568.1 histidine phosphatase family protein [Cohnella sp. REN36]